MNENSRQDGALGWTPPAPEHLQAMLPQYDQWEMIACGGMGAVYKALQISLDRPVAIKVLPPQIAQDEAEYVQRFKNEARTMARMNHPSIVSVYDFGETADGLLYFVMEFINGTDVFKMIHARKRLPPEHALAITAHVCDALAYAHERDVVHRDIKPANILINMDGAVKVADFGLASMLDPGQSGSVTQEGTTMGTPDYVAPEVLTIGMQVDGRADLYAVGVMLYNMLTGKIPRGSFQTPSERTGCDPRFDAIVRKAMEQDVERRYQSAREIRRDLDQILTVPVPKEKPARQAPAGGMLPRQPPPPPPPPGTPWGMIAAALIVLGVAAVLLMRPAHPPPTPEVTQVGPAKPEPPRPAPGPKPPATAPPVSGVSPADSNAPKGSPLSKFPVLIYNGHYYQVVAEQLNQSDAQKHAQSLGAHLATITSQGEQYWMNRVLPFYLQKVPQGMATIGGLRENGVWKWVTGEPFKFTNWEDATVAASEPEKNFVLKITATSYAKAEWGLGVATAKRAFLLEWDGRPSITPAPVPRPPQPAPMPIPMAESEGAKRLRKLDSSFHAALERDVLAVHRTALEDLDTKYLAALDRALSAETAAARLSEALALREEQQLIKSHSPLPPEDAPNLPAPLKTLRSTYRSSLHPIESALHNGIITLFRKYEEVLKAGQTEWTQAGKLDDARLANDRIASLSRERTALLDEAKELLPGGKEMVLQKNDRFISAEKFTPPVEFTLVVKTQKDDLRMAYTARQVIFNWDKNQDELRLDADPAGARHVPGMGRIPEDTFVTIQWRIMPHMQSITVDGKRRLLHFGDYSKVDNPLEVFPLNHPVTIKSAKVKTLDLPTAEDQITSNPSMRDLFLTKAEWTGRLTIPAGTYRPLRRIDIGAPGKKDPRANYDEQRADVTSLPGMRIENVRFHLREGSWQAAGGHFRDVKITADLGGSFEARDSLFQDCLFAKEGPWGTAYFSSKWQFTNCVIDGSFMHGWKVSEVGIKLDSCTLIDLDLGPIIFREDASTDLTKGWLSIQNCRFIRCRVSESLALITRNCVFEKCTFDAVDEKLQTKSPLQATLYLQDCTNQPQTGPGRTLETQPAAQLSTTPGASLPYELKNGQLDFQNPPQ
ncbi:MAG: protein kinase [Verrucomicrobia bacterium]|nr:protein kinase [Verrucomicrobiota bacterium]